MAGINKTIHDQFADWTQNKIKKALDIKNTNELDRKKRNETLEIEDKILYENGKKHGCIKLDNVDNKSNNVYANKLLCPVGDCSYTHVLDVDFSDHNRLKIIFYCESGHTFSVIIKQYKGYTYMEYDT